MGHLPSVAPSSAPPPPDIHALAAAVQALQESSGARFSAGDVRMSAIEAELKANTAITTQIRDLLAAARGGLRALGWLGAVVKWVGGVVGAAVAIYHAVQKFRGN